MPAGDINTLAPSHSDQTAASASLADAAAFVTIFLASSVCGTCCPRNWTTSGKASPKIAASRPWSVRARFTSSPAATVTGAVEAGGDSSLPEGLEAATAPTFPLLPAPFPACGCFGASLRCGCGESPPPAASTTLAGAGPPIGSPATHVCACPGDSLPPVALVGVEDFLFPFLPSLCWSEGGKKGSGLGRFSAPASDSAFTPKSRSSACRKEACMSESSDPAPYCSKTSLLLARSRSSSEASALPAWVPRHCKKICDEIIVLSARTTLGNARLPSSGAHICSKCTSRSKACFSS